MKQPPKHMNGFSSSAVKEHTDAGSRVAFKPARFKPAHFTGDDSFSAVFESSGEALLLTDTSGIIQRANSRARQVLGLKLSNPHSVDLGTVLAESSGAQLLLLCDSAKANKASAIDASLITGHSVRITLRAVLPGSHSLLLCLEEGSLVRRAEEKWRQVDAELRSVLDSVLTGILLLDSAGRVRF